MVLAGAKAEGQRLREAVEANGGKDRPINARPGENERFLLEIDRRDGEVSLRSTWGNGTPAWIWEGHGLQIRLAPNISRLALAALLEDTPDLVADVATSGDGDGGDYFRAADTFEATLRDLGHFWVMECDEWFADSMPIGTETDDDLRVTAAVREDNASGYDVEIFLPFDEAEAFEWLKRKRDEAHEELADAA